MGTGLAFRDPPLDSTLMVLQAYGQAQPWVLLTDTPGAETEPTCMPGATGLSKASGA